MRDNNSESIQGTFIDFVSLVMTSWWARLVRPSSEHQETENERCWQNLKSNKLPTANHADTPDANSNNGQISNLDYWTLCGFWWISKSDSETTLLVSPQEPTNREIKHELQGELQGRTATAFNIFLVVSSIFCMLMALGLLSQNPLVALIMLTAGGVVLAASASAINYLREHDLFKNGPPMVAEDQVGWSSYDTLLY